MNKKHTALFASVLSLIPFAQIIVFPINAETKNKKVYPKFDFYSQCLDDALPKTLNNGLVYECSMKALQKIDPLIDERINSRGACKSYNPKSHACSLKRNQSAFNSYVETECVLNKLYGPMPIFCEMMLKEDRLKWLDRTVGRRTKNN